MAESLPLRVLEDVFLCTSTDTDLYIWHNEKKDFTISTVICAVHKLVSGNVAVMIGDRLVFKNKLKFYTFKLLQLVK